MSTYKSVIQVTSTSYLRLVSAKNLSIYTLEISAFEKLTESEVMGKVCVSRKLIPSFSKKNGEEYFKSSDLSMSLRRLGGYWTLNYVKC